MYPARTRLAYSSGVIQWAYTVTSAVIRRPKSNQASPSGVVNQSSKTVLPSAAVSLVGASGRSGKSPSATRWASTGDPPWVSDDTV